MIKFIKLLFFLFLILLINLSFSYPLATFAQDTKDISSENRAFQSTSASLDIKVAPGDLLPVSIKLSNFGGGQRVDVSVTYLIISSTGQQVYKTSETVAVETTNNFVKNIQIPFSVKPGIYTVKTAIFYKGQVTPATTEFTFTVERKILGVFQNDFLIYGTIMLILGIVTTFAIYSLARRRNFSRFAPIDYSNVPKDERVFYELISDTVMDMRHKVGDRALDIVSSVEGLTFDPHSGRVIKLTKSPSKVIAELVLGYEKTLGEKVSFSFRKQK